jgi:hypothetical protein
MRNVIAFVVLLVGICGCTDRGGQPRLEPLARGLAEVWQPATRDLKLEIQAEMNGDRVTLHCVLQNTSATAIKVDSSTLPWITPGFFSIDAVTASGRVVHRNALVSQISNFPSPVSIASGESMVGAIDLGVMPITDLPRDEDLLLVWSYGLADGGSDAQYFLRGITLLKRKS